MAWYSPASGNPAGQRVEGPLAGFGLVPNPLGISSRIAFSARNVGEAFLARVTARAQLSPSPEGGDVLPGLVLPLREQFAEVDWDGTR